MTTTDIKVKLHEEIDHGDPKLLKMIYALIQEYQNDEEDDTISEQRKMLVREDRAKYLKGEGGRSYSWEEAKQMIINRQRPNEF